MQLIPYLYTMEKNVIGSYGYYQKGNRYYWKVNETINTVMGFTSKNNCNNWIEEKKNQLMLLKSQKEGMLTFLRLEEERINERKQMLEAFHKYRDSMIILIDKETERIHAMAKKEFVLKSGSHKIKALVNPINQTS